jgi:hypothetical protein
MFEDQMIEMLPARTTMSSCHPNPCGGRKSSGGSTTNIDSGNGNYNGNGNKGFIVVAGNLNGNTVVL